MKPRGRQHYYLLVLLTSASDHRPPLRSAPCDPNYRTALTESGGGGPWFLKRPRRNMSRRPPPRAPRQASPHDIPGPVVLPVAATSTPHTPCSRAPAPARTWPVLHGSPAPSLHPPCPAPGLLGNALWAARPAAACSSAATRTREQTGLRAGTRARLARDLGRAGGGAASGVQGTPRHAPRASSGSQSSPLPPPSPPR